MKTLRIPLEDSEYNAMRKEKDKFQVSWKNFIFCRCLKIRMKGEKGSFRREE